jgi:endonuclease-3
MQAQTSTSREALRPAEKKSRAKRPAAKKPAGRRPSSSERARITQVLDILDELYPDAHCELDFVGPFQLLIAVILSAQCTDDRVNLVTPELFRRYPDARALAQSDQGEVERLIYSTGFFRNKAKNIRAAAKKLVDKFGGQVPRTLAELLTLPGVARKTANVVLGTAYGIPSGVVVDTHVARLSQRLGMTRHSEPVKIEKDLMVLWQKERWIMSGHRLIWHGRRVCYARKPDCPHCPLAPLCPSAELP